MTKNRRTFRANGAVAILVGAYFFLTSAKAQAQLDETCTVSVNGQTVNVGFGGEFRIPNIPAGNNLVRLYAICTKDGKTRYGRSMFFQVQPRQTLVLSELDMLWRDTPFPSTAAIEASADMPTLTAIGQTTQIRVIATLSDSTQKEVTQRGFGSTYLTSNSNVATVDQNGLVTATGPGTVLITVNNEGAASTIRLNVAPPGLLTTVEGIVQNEDGTPAVGAVVVVPGGGETTAAADGRFSVSGVFTQLGTLAVRAYNLGGNQLRLGMTGQLRIITGGITDAGIIVIKPVTNYVYWNTPVSGSWTDATKWSTGRVPRRNENIFIGVPGNITVTFSTDSSTAIHLVCDENLIVSAGVFTVVDSSEFTSTLTLSGGMLRGTFNRNTKFLIFGQFHWLGGLIDGAITGSIIIAPSGNMNINGSGAVQDITRCTVNIAGSATWSGNANLRGSAPTIFNVLAGGLFEAQNDRVFFSATAVDPIFNNAGTFLKSAGSDTTKFQGTVFNSSGIIDIRSGTLHINSGGTYTGGDFRVATGAALEFTFVVRPARPYIFSGGFSKTGGGTLHFGGGTYQIAAEGATFNFTGNTLQWTGGMLSGPGALTNLGTINLGGTGLQTFSSLTLNNTNTLHLSGTGTKRMFRLTLNNNGLVTWSGAGNIVGGSATILNNLAGGIFEIQNDTTLSLGAGGGVSNFNNMGTIRKSSGARITLFSNFRFNNNGGTLDIQRGTLRLAAGGSNTGGNYIVASNATLDLTGGAIHTYSGTYTNSGGGTITVGTGSIMQVSTAGTTFNFSGNAFQWTGGTLQGPGVLTNIGTMSLSGVAIKNFSNVTFNNAGTVTWSGAGTIGGGGGAAINNLAGALFDIRNDTTASFGGGGGSVNNAGTVRKSSGNRTTTFGGGARFNNNNGLIEVQTGTLSLSGGGTSMGGNFIVASGATLNLTGGAIPTLTGSYTGSGDGAVRFSGGSLNIGAAGATFNFSGNLFQWTGGNLQGPGALTNTGTMNLSGTATKTFISSTFNNAGTVTWSGTGGFTLSTGAIFNNLAGGVFDILNNATLFIAVNSSFTNAGTFRKSIATGTTTFTGAAFINNGTVDMQSGILSLSNKYTQAPSGTLIISIGGLTAGTQFSRLLVSGSAPAATLNGMLTVNLVSFEPSIDNTFQIMTFTTRGSVCFDQINLPPLPAGRRWRVNCTGSPTASGSLTLVVEAALAEQ